MNTKQLNTKQLNTNKPLKHTDRDISILDLELSDYNDSTNLLLRNVKDDSILIRSVTLIEIIKTIQGLKDEISYLKTRLELIK